MPVEKATHIEGSSSDWQKITWWGTITRHVILFRLCEWLLFHELIFDS
jgi:hypothetical protein